MGLDLVVHGELTYEQKASFAAVADKVIACCGAVDGLLRDGGLDCRKAYQAALSMLPEAGRQQLEEGLLVRITEFERGPVVDDWPYWSAVEFLTVCKQHNLEVYLV